MLTGRTAVRTISVAVVAVAAAAVGACGPVDWGAASAESSATTPDESAPVVLTDEEVAEIGMERAVVVSGATCGDAGGALGSGVIVGPDRVLTAAHVIAGVAEIEVSIRADHPERAEQRQPGSDRASDDMPDVASAPATIVAFDRLRDLALLEVDLSQWQAPATELDFAVLGSGDTGVVVGALTSGDVGFTISKKTSIEADEVRGDRRSLRSGYLVSAATTSGDSGAALYDRSGRFAGVLFAVSTDDGRRSWATAADEVEEFLADRTVAGEFACNPDRSIVEAAGG